MKNQLFPSKTFNILLPDYNKYMMAFLEPIYLNLFEKLYYYDFTSVIYNVLYFVVDKLLVIISCNL